MLDKDTSQERGLLLKIVYRNKLKVIKFQKKELKSKKLFNQLLKFKLKVYNHGDPIVLLNDEGFPVRITPELPSGKYKYIAPPK